MSKKYKYRERWVHEGVRVDVKANSKAELRDKIAKKKQALEEGRILVESNMLLKDWVNIAYSQYKTGVSDITLKREKQKCQKWLVEPLGHMPLKKIKPLHLQGVLNELQGYSSTFVKEVHRIYKWVFNLAVQNDLIVKSPASNLTKPQAKPIQINRELSAYEREHFLKVCDEDELMRYFLVQLYCGLRPHEAQELQYRDIDRKNRLMHIRGTKTRNADRFVPIVPYLLERLPEGEPFDYVFKSASGAKINENTHRGLWKRLKREINISMGCKVFRNQLVPPYPLDESLKPYCLRHTYCTDLCKNGIDIRVAQRLMGHSDISLTANIYSHVDKSMVIDAGAKLEKAYQKEQKTDKKGETSGETMPKVVAITG